MIREGAKFHDGAPVTPEDVKFTFERYRGTAHVLMEEAGRRGGDMQDTDMSAFIFGPFPRFLIFYGTASGAGWIVPKKPIEKVGKDGFKKAPIGAGPYKFVSFKPGLELVLEAFDRILAQNSRRQTADIAGYPRRSHATGSAEKRRSGYCLLGARRACPGAGAHSRPDG